jgi:hypothetical protein
MVSLPQHLIRREAISLHFASGILLEPGVILIIPLRSFGFGFRNTHPIVDQHLDQVINVSLSIITISFRDF